jgi:hypothetical protein
MAQTCVFQVRSSQFIIIISQHIFYKTRFSLMCGIPTARMFWMASGRVRSGARSSTLARSSKLETVRLYLSGGGVTGAGSSCSRVQWWLWAVWRRGPETVPAAAAGTSDSVRARAPRRQGGRALRLASLRRINSVPFASVRLRHRRTRTLSPAEDTHSPASSESVSG